MYGVPQSEQLPIPSLRVVPPQRAQSKELTLKFTFNLADDIFGVLCEDGCGGGGGGQHSQCMWGGGFDWMVRQSNRPHS